MMAPSNTSWVQFDEPDEGLIVETSSASQLWRRTEWDRVSDKLSQLKKIAHTARPASRHKSRHAHRHVLHPNLGQSRSPETPPLRLNADKWPASFPLYGGMSPAPTSPSGRSSRMSDGRSIALEEMPFDEFMGLAVERQSPPGYASSVRSNTSGTNMPTFDSGGFEQIARWGFGSNQQAALQVQGAALLTFVDSVLANAHQSYMCSMTHLPVHQMHHFC